MSSHDAERITRKFDRQRRRVVAAVSNIGPSKIPTKEVAMPKKPKTVSDPSTPADDLHPGDAATAAHDASGTEDHVLPRPSVPGFSVDEAKELLGMCAVANYLGPVVFPPFPIGLVATDDPDNPLPYDDGRTYPYPAQRIWPSGWGPGVPTVDAERPWATSIVTSRLANGAPVNGAIVAHNAARKAYAIAFAGTLNPGAAMQDEAAMLIPAGPVDLPYLRSSESYATYIPTTAEFPSGGITYSPLPQPPQKAPMVHLGYRVAVESLTVDPLLPLNLRTILMNIPEDEIDLYVTGHSLGASVAQLFSAWVRAGGVPLKKINVKCYSFATPKSCNTTMAANYALALGNGGFSYRVENSLDTAPQLPPSKTETADLINPAIAGDLGSKAEPVGLYASSPLAPLVEAILGSQPHEPANLPLPFAIIAGVIGSVVSAVSRPSSAVSMDYVGMGVPHVLAAQYPVVYDGRFYPSYLFPARDPADPVLIPDDTTRQWWQHWPYSYAKYLAVA
jgi:hypothetical protein